jgi:outer membrane receptor for ferrienterochelin and colicin
MRGKAWLAVVALLLSVANAAAQSTTGTISGRVVDTQGLPVPGVTVTATSPNLQGVRETVTSENGDYILTLLPSGSYNITFDLTGFQRQQRTAVLAPTQVLPIEVTMGPAALTEAVQVVGRSDPLTQTAQVATNFSHELISQLPTSRDLNSVLMLAPGVHPTGPAGNYSFGGSVSYENLFLLNGVTINENVRGQAYDLYIEDAIQETTVANGGVSAEFGRFSGGMVNIITKSGGNTFSGSFRDSLNNEKWRKLTPFEDRAIEAGGADPRVDTTVPTYEYTFGGPIMRDRLWFFTSGRVQDQETAQTLIASNFPYTSTDESRRYEIKGSYSMTSNHRFESTYTTHRRTQDNYTFNRNLSMDLRSLGTRQLPEELVAFSYTGVLTPKIFFEGRYSNRDQSFENAGAKSTDLIEGTLLLDQSRGNTRYWSDTFCGVCTPEGRDNSDLFVKATYFLSTPRAGSHTIAGGYDVFNDIRLSDNHQSGSGYRIFGTSAIVNGAEANQIFPVFLGDGSTIIQWNPILSASEGADFRTHSVFFNDSWRISDRLSANLGVRWDKNDGKDQSGNVVAKDSAWSPRLGVIWDPFGDARWSVTGSLSKYVAAISSPVADSSAEGGNPQNRQFIYRGPNINPPGTAALTPTADAVRAVFDWFFANGGAALPLAAAPTIPGVTPQIGDDLKSPSAWEAATGVSRQFGARAAVRSDFLYRNYVDLYMRRADLSTGRVQAPDGRFFDLTVIENAPDGLMKRRYAGLTLTGTYRFGTLVDIGGNYTLSRAWGNNDAENINSGPVPFDFRYPEYKEASWNFPEGDLGVDQRHRSRLWVNYSPTWVSGLTLSVLQAFDSGVPYAAGNTNGIDPRPYVTNPGYLTPPGSTATTYYFGPRDEFRTEGQVRTDFAANYAHRIPRAGSLQVFAQLQVLNIFNQFQLCACGSTIFGTGSAGAAGGINASRIDQTVLTPGTTPARFAAFNPFTTTPVRGVNWDYGPQFGQALNRFAYTTPRTLRLSFGVRF